MAASTYQKTNADGSIVIKDGTGTPLTLTIPFTRGDIKIGPLKAKLKNTVAIQARGVHLGIRHTDRVYPTFSLSCFCPEWTAASGGTPTDMIFGKAAFSAAISVDGATADVKTRTVVITVEGTDFGDGADKTVTLTNVECEVNWTEDAGGNYLEISGTVYGAITGDLACG
jgi:hypothetical protein